MRWHHLFLYFSGFGSCFSPASVADPDEEKQQHREVPARGCLPWRRSGEEGLWHRHVQTQWETDLEEAPPSLRLPSALPSLLPALEGTSSASGFVPDWPGREDGWRFLLARAEVPGWSRCIAEELSCDPQRCLHMEEPISILQVWDSEDSSFSPAVSLHRQGLGTSFTEEHRTWIPWSSGGPIMRTWGQSPSLKGKRHVSEACGPWGSGVPEAKV